MEIQLVKRSTVWRGRGRPPREVPEKILGLLQNTYRTGDVGRIPIPPDDDEDQAAEVRELLGFLRTGAARLGKRVRIQEHPEDHEIVFEMVDKGRRPPRGKRA